MAAITIQLNPFLKSSLMCCFMNQTWGSPVLGVFGVITHRHSDVCSSLLSHLCLPVDVNGLYWFKLYFLDGFIVKETGDLAWFDQDFELMPLSIIQSLRESTNMHFINTFVLPGYLKYKDTFTESLFIYETESYLCTLSPESY